MEAFVRAQVKEVRREPGARAPDLRKCLEVTKVARRCPAAAAGVQKGDWLASVDGTPASQYGSDFFKVAVEQRAYVFHSKQGGAIHLKATGIEPGAAFRPTAQGIAATYDPAGGEFDKLVALWEAGEWELLRRLTEAGGKPGLLGRLTGSVRDTPETVLLGAALFELGRREEGMKLVRGYLNKVAPNWTQDFIAVGLYCVGLEAVQAGDRQAALGLFAEAFEKYPSDRIANAIERLTGGRPEPEQRWLGQPWPAEYALALLETRGPAVSLSATLASMAEGRRLIVCLLANYRGNGPYNEFMKRYMHYHRYFSAYLQGLHVVTMEPVRKAERAHYYEAEERARRAGLPVTILHDADGAVTEALEPTGSPTVYLLEKTGTVVHEGALEPVDLWDALSGP